MEHLNIPAGEIHKPHNYEFPNVTARLIDIGYTSYDIGKLALQLDTHVYWSVKSVSPLVWAEVGASVPDPLSVNNLAVASSMTFGADCDIYQNAEGSFGWSDNIQAFTFKDTASNAPSWGSTIGNFEGYIWSPTALKQVMVDFHIDHDYAIGTPLYPHVHFRPLTNDAGVVRWGFEYTVSKGHGQTVGMAASTTVYVNFSVGSNNLGTHYVAEVAALDAIAATYAEPDSVIHVRIFRDAANAADTYPGNVWAWQADLHYQFARLGTLNRAPNFYT